MKLFSKYNQLNITATVIIFLAGSATFYLLLHYILIRQIDETLTTEQQEVIEYNSSHNALPEILPTKDEHTAYFIATSLIPASIETIDAHYRGKDEPFREIRFGQKIAGKYYIIAVSKPLEETESLLKIIILVTVCMIALILLAGYFINKSFLSKLWQPFYHTIHEVKSYDLSNHSSISFGQTDIDEFSLLNQSLTSMTEKVQNDYLILKEFTGHASHEMQTPLAIIRTRLDMLIQNENLLLHDARYITDIENAVHRLSRLNQSLLLLTKVENRQFILNEHVVLDELIRNKCAEFAEMADSKKLYVSMEIEPMAICFHQHLSEIMISNLLNNAIRYNKESGSIHISLQSGKLSISNTSQFPGLARDKVFSRFYRYLDIKEEGNGLGLSIVKKICEVAGYPIQYMYVNDLHYFVIDFGESRNQG